MENWDINPFLRSISLKLMREEEVYITQQGQNDITLYSKKQNDVFFR